MPDRQVVCNLCGNSSLESFDPFRDYFTQAYATAVKSGVEFNITLDDLKTQWTNQSGICAISGATLTLPGFRTRRAKAVHIAHLDRIDISQGFVPGNIQWISQIAHTVKTLFTTQQLFNFCKRVVVYNGL